MVEYIEILGDYCGIGDIGLVVYMNFARNLHCYLSRATEPGLAITGALTFGGWVWFGYKGRGKKTSIMGKWYEGVEERSYVLYKSNTEEITFSISATGSNALNTVTDYAINSQANKWHYIVCRYTPSEEIALYVDGEWYTNIVDIPASIHDSTEAFEIGRSNRDNYFEGRMSHMFICAEALENSDIEAMYYHTKAMFFKLKEVAVLSGIMDRVTNAALMIEYLADDLLCVTNAALMIEYAPAKEINVSDFAVMIESENTPIERVSNFAIMIEAENTPYTRVSNFAVMIEHEPHSYLLTTNAALMIEYTDYSSSSSSTSSSSSSTTTSSSSVPP
jgi:hypothetical protein